MRDDRLDTLIWQMQDRHAPDGPLIRTLRDMSFLTERAREIRKERGPQAAPAIIRSELIPQYLRASRDLMAGLNGANDQRTRDDFGRGYGMSLIYRESLSSLARMSPGDWSMIEMDAGRGVAA